MLVEEFFAYFIQAILSRCQVLLPKNAFRLMVFEVITEVVCVSPPLYLGQTQQPVLSLSNKKEEAYARIPKK